MERLQTNLYITSVEKEGPFLKIWGQLDKNTALYLEQVLFNTTSQFDSGMGKINEHSIQVGVLCCAKYKDHKYYRARITDVKYKKNRYVEVFFIDFGNTDQVPLSSVRCLEGFDPQFLSVPPQATPFILAECLTPGGVWNDSVLEEIANEVRYNECVFTIVAQVTKHLLVRVFRGQHDLAAILITRGFLRHTSIVTQEAVLLSTVAQQQVTIQAANNTVATKKMSPPARSTSPQSTLASYKAFTLEAGNSYMVYVSYVTDGPCNFSVQLKQSEEVLCKLMKEINSMEVTPLDCVILPGTICLARCNEDGHICRAVVTNEVDGQFKVFYVDFGNFETVPMEALYEIPFRFVIPKVMSIRFCLAGIEKATVTVDMQYAFKQFVDNRLMQMKVLPQTGKTAALPKCDLWDPNTNVNALDVVQQAAGTSYPEHVSLNRGFTQQIKVSFVYSCNRFFVQLKAKEDELADLMVSLQELHQESEQLDPNEWKVGRPCYALFDADLQWYRSQIVEMVDLQHAKIQYVDYGNEEIVPASSLKTIDGKMVTALRPQAIECSLNGYQKMQPDPERDELFEELIMEQEFMMKVVEMSGGKALVELYDANNYNVASLLLEKLALTRSQASPMLVQGGSTFEFRKPKENQDTRPERRDREQNHKWREPSEESSWRQGNKNDSERNDSNENNSWRQNNRGIRNRNDLEQNDANENSSWRQNNKGFNKGYENDRSSRDIDNNFRKNRDNNDDRFNSRPPRRSETGDNWGARKDENHANPSRERHRDNNENNRWNNKRSSTTPDCDNNDNWNGQNPRDTPNTEDSWNHSSGRQSNQSSNYNASAETSGDWGNNSRNNTNTREQRHGDNKSSRDSDSNRWNGSVSRANDRPKRSPAADTEDSWGGGNNAAPTNNSRSSNNEDNNRWSQNNKSSGRERKPSADSDNWSGSGGGDRKNNRFDRNNDDSRRKGGGGGDSWKKDGGDSSSDFGEKKRFNDRKSNFRSDGGMSPSGSEKGGFKKPYSKGRNEGGFQKSKSFTDRTAVPDAASPTDKFTVQNVANKECTVTMSWFHNPLHFYCQLDETQTEFKQLMDDIQEAYKSRQPSKAEVGAPAIGLFPEDGVLYRAEVLEIVEGSRYKIYYVDFGNISVIDKVWPIERRFMNLPAQAVCCSLAGVLPPYEGDQWPEASSYATYFDKKQFQCQFMDYVDDRVLVNLYYEDQSIAEQLTGAELALPSAYPSPPIETFLLVAQQFRANLVSVNSPSDFVISPQPDVFFICCLFNLENCVEGCEDLLKQNLAQELVVYVNEVQDDERLEVTLYCADGTKLNLTSNDEINPETVELPCPYLILSSALSGYVSYAEGTHIYVQPLECGDVINALVDDLFTTYEESILESPIVPEQDGVYAVRSSDGNWYRAKVKNVGDELILVNYLDYGNSEELSCTEFRELTPEFMAIQTLCVQMNIDIDAASYIDQTVNLTIEFTDVEIKGTIIEGTQQEISEVPPQEAEVPLQEAEVLPVEAGLEEPEVLPQTSEEPLQSEEIVEENVEYAQETVGTPIILSHVDSPSDFYVQLLDSSCAIDELQDLLQTEAPEMPDLESPTIGVLCAAPYSLDQQWYRAQVLDLDADITTVRFVDYGNTDVLDNHTTKVKTLPQNLLQLEVHATRCRMKIKPFTSSATTADGEQHEEWSPAVAERFEQLTASDNLTCEFVDQDEKLNYVELYANGENIKDILIRENLAVADEVLPDSNSYGFVSHLNSPSEFWIQLENCIDELEWVAEQLSAVDSFPELEDLAPGTLCAAHFSDDQMWYRARILSNTVAGIEVLFIDYGNSCCTSSALKELPEDLVMLPALAQKCSLQKPKSLMQWGPAMASKFKEIAADGQTTFTVRKLSTGETATVELLLQDQDVATMLLPLQTEEVHVKTFQTLDDLTLTRKNGEEIPQQWKLESLPDLAWNEDSVAEFAEINEECKRIFQAEFVSEDTVRLYTDFLNDIRLELTGSKKPSANATPIKMRSESREGSALLESSLNEELMVSNDTTFEPPQKEIIQPILETVVDQAFDQVEKDKHEVIKPIVEDIVNEALDQAGTTDENEANISEDQVIEPIVEDIVNEAFDQGEKSRNDVDVSQNEIVGSIANSPQNAEDSVCPNKIIEPIVEDIVSGALNRTADDRAIPKDETIEPVVEDIMGETLDHAENDDADSSAVVKPIVKDIVAEVFSQIEKDNVDISKHDSVELVVQDIVMRVFDQVDKDTIPNDDTNILEEIVAEVFSQLDKKLSLQLDTSDDQVESETMEYSEVDTSNDQVESKTQEDSKLDTSDDHLESETIEDSKLDVSSDQLELGTIEDSKLDTTDDQIESQTKLDTSDDQLESETMEYSKPDTSDDQLDSETTKYSKLDASVDLVGSETRGETKLDTSDDAVESETEADSRTKEVSKLDTSGEQVESKTKQDSKRDTSDEQVESETTGDSKHDTSDDQVESIKEDSGLDSSDEQVEPKKEDSKLDTSDDQVESKEEDSKLDTSDDLVESERTEESKLDTSGDQVESEKAELKFDTSDNQLESTKEDSKLDTSDDHVETEPDDFELGIGDEKIEERSQHDASDEIADSESKESSRHDSSDDKIESETMEDSKHSDEKGESKLKDDSQLGTSDSAKSVTSPTSQRDASDRQTESQSKQTSPLETDDTTIDISEAQKITENLKLDISDEKTQSEQEIQQQSHDSSKLSTVAATETEKNPDSSPDSKNAGDIVITEKISTKTESEEKDSSPIGTTAASDCDIELSVAKKSDSKQVSPVKKTDDVLTSD